jgi:transposase
MSLARLVITAVIVEGRSKSAVARDYGITRFWVQTLAKRFEAEGEAAFQPHSRRPHTNPRAIDLEVEDQIVRLRKTPLVVEEVLCRPAQRTLAGRHHPLAPRRRHRGRDPQHPR